MFQLRDKKGKIITDRIGKMTKKEAIDAGIDYNLHPYTLRKGEFDYKIWYKHVNEIYSIPIIKTSSGLTEAEQHEVNSLVAAGISPFQTKMHFRKNKLRGEIEMIDSKRKTVKKYIKHLQKARTEVETKINEIVGADPNLTSEFMTLGVVIKDLEKIDAQEFSYWDVS